MNYLLTSVAHAALNEEKMTEELLQFQNELAAQLLSCGSNAHAASVINLYFADLLFLRSLQISAQLHRLVEENIRHLQSRYPEWLHKTRMYDHTPINKFVLHLSVAQAAVWIRLFCDTKLINADSKMQLITALCRHLSTQKQQDISAESFYGKFYKMDRTSLESVKDQLIKMLNTVNGFLKD